jgi:hypothetical protein
MLTIIVSTGADAVLTSTLPAADFYLAIVAYDLEYKRDKQYTAVENQVIAMFTLSAKAKVDGHRSGPSDRCGPSPRDPTCTLT